MATKTISLVPQCRVIHFPWEKKSLLGDDTDTQNELFENYKNKKLDPNFTSEEIPLDTLVASDAVDISDSIMEVVFTKMQDAAAGSFSITLAANKDWRKEIKVGTWLLIYMSQEGDLVSNGIDALKSKSSKLRCMGYVERVSVSSQTGTEKGEIIPTFTITGSDFGTIFEQTSLWFSNYSIDRFFFITVLQDALKNSDVDNFKTVDELLKIMFNVILAPIQLGEKVELARKQILGTLQWALPPKLLELLRLELSLSNEPYFGNIKDVLNFEKSVCTQTIYDPLSSLSGDAWSQLKSKSIEPFHELFAELDDNGKPQLIFRPIPWRLFDNPETSELFLNDSKGIIFNLPRVVVNNYDLISFDVGRDDHSRYNLFITDVQTANTEASSSIAFLNNEFPKSIPSSVKRHGVRLSQNTVDALFQITANEQKEVANPKLLLAFNKLMQEYWEIAHELDSGTINIIGNNLTRVGKTLELTPDIKFLGNKIYYIEGYVDTFTIDSGTGAGSWTQSVTVTRGIDSRQSTQIIEDTYSGFGDFTPSAVKRSKSGKSKK